MTFFLSTAVSPPPPPSTHLSSVLIRRGVRRLGGKEGTQSVGCGGGVLENGGRAPWNVGQSGGRRFHGNSVHSSQWHHPYGRGDQVRKWEGVGGATEMHPDWLGVKRDSLRPLWSSATSWSEDKDKGGVWKFFHKLPYMNEKQKSFTFCSGNPCVPVGPPGTPGDHQEVTGSESQRSPPSPCRPWPGQVTGAEATCWRNLKTPSSIPPNVPGLRGQMPA